MHGIARCAQSEDYIVLNGRRLDLPRLWKTDSREEMIVLLETGGHPGLCVSLPYSEAKALTWLA